MNDHSEQFRQHLQEVSLTPEERQLIRSKLHAAIQLQRPPAGARAFLVRHAAVCSAAVFVLMAGTTAGAAQRALPGDFLYPVRVGVNERVALIIAGGEEARMERELQQLERALDEEEFVATYALADFMVDDGGDADQRGAQLRSDDAVEERGDGTVSGGISDRVAGEATIESDAELESELRVLEHLLDDEEGAGEIELSL